ncbi:putative methyltransferase PMT6 [Ananas comosus]|uniref:Methyltransferase n=1 Tax=Ananas comosus TaxID=4615 RepID=A0A199VYH1_ANACO|nr:putative methyltransferase PMT6 [Ananas comosus]
MLPGMLDSRSVQLTLVGLLLVVASFYAGTLFSPTPPPPPPPSPPPPPPPQTLQVKGGQNWIHEKGKLWWFPGGGTHFKHGAAEYIERLGNMTTDETGDLRTAGVVQVLDVGCGVASFSAYLLPLDIHTMSFAPKDGHENQIQFALERGIGAMISVLATKQLPFPRNSFEMVHCSRCRVDWHENDGILLKEVDRLLRPNGYFVYSAPPAYRKDKDYPIIWDKLVNLTAAMCWKLIARQVQTAIWLKPEDDSCRKQNAERNLLSICDAIDDSVPSWKTPMRNCLILSTEQSNFQRLPPRPDRLSVYSKSLEKIGVTPEKFDMNNQFWQEQVRQYWTLISADKTDIRNVMDMSAYYGGFSVALSTLPAWGFIIIRDEDSIVSRIRDLAPKFLWDTTSHMLENEEKRLEPVLICRKKFWAIV